MFLNFKKAPDEDVLEVHCFNKRKRLIETLFIKDTDSFDSEPPLELPGKTWNVNLAVREDMEFTKNLFHFYETRTRMYKKFAKYESLILPFLLAPLSYLLLDLLAENKTIYYMIFGTLALGFLLISVTSLINYGLISLWIRRKSLNRGEFSG